jgi:hypothetical protein
MDNKTLIINLNLFSFNQPIYVVDDRGMYSVGAFTIEELPNAIVSVAAETNINAVRILGSGTYAQDLISEIQLAEQAKYSKNKLEIEVM